MPRPHQGARYTWPKKDEEYRLYRLHLREDGESWTEYMLVLQGDDHKDTRGRPDALVCGVRGDPNSLYFGSVDVQHILGSCSHKRVTWDELPPEWQDAYLRWGVDASARGLHLTTEPDTPVHKVADLLWRIRRLAVDCDPAEEDPLAVINNLAKEALATLQSVSTS